MNYPQKHKLDHLSKEWVLFERSQYHEALFTDAIVYVVKQGELEICLQTKPTLTPFSLRHDIKWKAWTGVQTYTGQSTKFQKIHYTSSLSS